MNIIQNIIHRSHKKDCLNILIILFRGDFEYQFAKLNHNLYIVGNMDKIEKYEAANGKPPNITFFPVQKENVKISRITSIDLIISNGRINYSLGKRLQNFYQCPVINVEHDTPELKKWQKNHINDEVKDIITVSPNETIFKYWDEYGILINKAEDWQKLLYDVTKGGFNNENICKL